MMTSSLFSNFTAWKQKFAPNKMIVRKNPFDVSLSFDVPNNFIQSFLVTVVYWDNGVKKIIKEAMISELSINFSI